MSVGRLPSSVMHVISRQLKRGIYVAFIFIMGACAEGDTVLVITAFVGVGVSSAIVACGPTSATSGIPGGAVSPSSMAIVFPASEVGKGMTVPARMAAELSPALPGEAMVVFQIVVVPALLTWLPTEAGKVASFSAVIALLCARF